MGVPYRAGSSFLKKKKIQITYATSFDLYKVSDPSGYDWCGPRVAPTESGPRVTACIKDHAWQPVVGLVGHAWQLPKRPCVGTSEAATRGTPLTVCHAANLAWATIHYCVANVFMMRGTTQKCHAYVKLLVSSTVPYFSSEYAVPANRLQLTNLQVRL